MRGRLHVLIPLAMLVAAVALRMVQPPLIERARLAAFETYQQLDPRPYQPVGVRIVDIDDASLQRLGQWPWPRSLVARMLGRLHDLGALVVGFDVLFAEPDRTSPANVLPLWQDLIGDEGLGDLAARLPDHDLLLAQQFARGPTVAGFFLSPDPNDVIPARKVGWAYAGDDPLQFLPPFPGAIVNLPAIQEAAWGIGALNYIPGADGIIRRVPLVFHREGENYPLPSLAAEMLRVVQGAGNILVKSSGASGETDFGENTGIVSIRIGNAVIPTDANGRVWLHDTGHQPDRFVPVWQLFEPDFDASRIEGHLVLVGTSAAGLKDSRPTPLERMMPGVEIHAQIIEQIALGHFLKRPDIALGMEVTYTIILGLLLIVLVEWLGGMWVAPIGAAALAVALGGSWYAFKEHRWLLDPIFPTIALLLVYLSASLVQFLKSEYERRWVRGAFSMYLSPALVEQLAQSPEKLALGGEMRPMSIMFCDVRGFTTISENYDPQGLTRLINGFLTPMTDIIMKNAGTIDKYIGDCIMALWNAPLTDPQHARHACVSALEMMARMPELNAEWAAEAEAEGRRFTPLAIGIGINTGEACVGNMGSEQRFDYSVLGDSVNLASRLEGQSKTYGVDIVISEETREAVPDFATLELDLIRVKGKTRPVRIHALMGGADIRASDWFAALAEAHAAMLAAYRALRFDEAREHLERCAQLAPEGSLDTLYRLYEERISACRAAPPPEDWDGVYVAMSK